MRWVIDTNVIVQWIMSRYILVHLIQHLRLSGEFESVYCNRYKDSIEFINRVISLSSPSDSFSITELSINEMVSAIRDEARCLLLFAHGIPISKWPSKRVMQDSKLSEKLRIDIYELMMKGLDELVGNGNITILSSAVPSEFETYLDVYSSFILLFPELQTQDAILLTSAVFEKADNFVTLDSGIRKLKQDVSNQYKMEIINPNEALQLLKSQS